MVTFAALTIKQTVNTMAGKSSESSTLSKKSFKAYTKKNSKNCDCCARVIALPESAAIVALPDGHGKEDSLALVPFQKVNDDPGCAIVVQESNHSKPGWSLLRQVFLPKKHMQKSYVCDAYVFQREVRHTSWHSSAVVHPDLKQINVDNSTLDGKSGAIVPYVSAANSGFTDFPKELFSLREKYSSLCRVYSFQELASATANFSPGLFSSLSCHHLGYSFCLRYILTNF